MKGVALVTGAASGIGRATATAFARAGADVVVADTSEAGREVAEQLGGLFVQCDVTRDAEVDAMIAKTMERYSRLDWAVNNAGIEGDKGSVAEYDADAWRRVIEVDLVSVFLCMRAELRVMQAAGHGAIVNVSSIFGSVGAPNASAYTAAKHGVIGLTRSAALENAKGGIRINAVCPGYIETPMVMDRGIAAGRDPKKRALVESRQPMERLGQPEEVANAIVWLCSDAASLITGHPLVIDGGFVAR